VRNFNSYYECKNASEKALKIDFAGKGIAKDGAVSSIVGQMRHFVLRRKELIVRMGAILNRIITREQKRGAACHCYY